MMRLLAVVPVLALGLLPGCPSFTTMGTARTMPKGKGQLYVATGATSLASFQRDPSTGRRDSFTIPSLEVGGRFALSDAVEVGGKVWPLGAELNSKFGLVRSATQDAGVNLAVAPAASVYTFSAGSSQAATYVWLHAPLLIGISVPGGSELTFGPRVSDMLMSSGGDRLNVVFLGGSLGYAWKVGDGFRILPELAFGYPVAASVGGASVTDFEPKGALIQANLGFLLGGD
jgi:hypothetical protein